MKKYMQSTYPNLAHNINMSFNYHYHDFPPTPRSPKVAYDGNGKGQAPESVELKSRQSAQLSENIHVPAPCPHVLSVG